MDKLVVIEEQQPYNTKRTQPTTLLDKTRDIQLEGKKNKENYLQVSEIFS